MSTLLIIVWIWLVFSVVAVIIMVFAYGRGYKHGALDGFHEGFLAATNHVIEETDPFIEAQRRAGDGASATWACQPPAVESRPKRRLLPIRLVAVSHGRRSSDG